MKQDKHDICTETKEDVEVEAGKLDSFARQRISNRKIL